MFKFLNDDFLKILNLKNVDSFEIFNNRYIINYSLEEIVSHLTKSECTGDIVYKSTWDFLKNNKEFVLNKFKKEIRNPSSFFYQNNKLYELLDYALCGQGFLYFIVNVDKDVLYMFLSLFFIDWDVAISIYEYTNDKLIEEASFLTKKEYDEIFIGEFLDNLKNIAIKKVLN